jgi:hypothetical protein
MFFCMPATTGEKLDELFSVAVNFVKDQANWGAITTLANHNSR